MARKKKRDPKVSSNTEQLQCDGCGQWFLARDQNWVALASGHYVHKGGKWGQNCHEKVIRECEARRVHEAACLTGTLADDADGVPFEWD